MKAIKIILVDDEKHCTETLSLQIKALKLNADIIAKFNNPVEALRFISSNEFDLLFLDIEMPQMSGFDMLSALSSFHFDVVFTTAYNQYAIKAFKYSALNYLLKPVDDDELRQCFDMWLQKNEKNLDKNLYSHFLELLSEKGNPIKKIAIPVSDGYDFINTDGIVRCQADNYYTHFFMDDGRDILVCRTLKEAEVLLKPFGFVRIHQSHMVNPNHIKKISRKDGGLVITSDGSTLNISKGYKEELGLIFDKINRL